MNKQITKQILIIGYDGRGLGWVVLFKIPWSIYPMLFRVTNLSALLLPYFTVMLFFFFFASPWQWEPTGVSGFFFFFFFSYFSAGLSGNDVHSLASSFILAFSHFPALFFIQHKYLLVPTAMASQHLLCNLYKALLYVHDIELVEIGVWWTMSVCFFFHPTRPKHREIKMEKQKKKSLAMTLIIAMIVTAMTTVNI